VDRFQCLFDSNSVGIILCGFQGQITEANDHFLGMLGYAREDLPLRADRMTPPRWHDLDAAKAAEVMATGAGTTWEKEYIARDGRHVPVNVAVTLLDPSTGSCVAIVHDASKRKRLEASLQEREETYRTLYDNIPLMYLTLAVDGTIRSINANGAMELGYERDELLGQPALTLVHPEDRDVIGQLLTSVKADREDVEYWQARLMRKGGRVMWTRSATRRVRGAGAEDLLLVACTDITRRHAAEQRIAKHQEELGHLAARLGLAEERERRRIATGLHDEIGHTLALARLRLGQLAASGHSEEDAELIRRVDALLDEAIGATRSLTFELCSPVLYELGLVAAIDSLVDETVRRHGIEIRFGAEQGLGPVDDDVAVVLYRIVRELLHNVVKHARARHARLSLESAGGEIRITLDDDGVGFDATGAGESFDTDGGFGLFSIHQQLNLIGGRLEIDSSTGRGTRAVVVARPSLDEDNEA
jgi:PAS domain S-box-containing protein